MHYVEDCFRERLPVALYDPKPASVRVRDASGVELAVRQFYFSQEARTRRNFAPVEQALLRAKTMQTARIGNSRLLRVSARSVLECARRLVDEGRGFYR
jgi:hypothetical protein